VAEEWTDEELLLSTGDINSTNKEGTSDFVLTDWILHSVAMRRSSLCLGISEVVPRHFGAHSEEQNNQENHAPTKLVTVTNTQCKPKLKSRSQLPPDKVTLTCMLNQASNRVSIPAHGTTP
jgi:hypothetical protein